ncbi:MAG: thermonuclease family protein [Sneathiella sp.]|nr:thermonuclease family protein [Sneathiella sp.]
MLKFILIVAFLFLPHVGFAKSDGLLERNHYWGKVTSVYDGDSITAAIALWPGQTVNAKIRLRGIDAPELRGKCDFEIRKAKKARDYLIERLLGSNVRITKIAVEKYGRILATVWSDGGHDIAKSLYENELAVLYNGGKRRNWCQ